MNGKPPSTNEILIAMLADLSRIFHMDAALIQDDASDESLFQNHKQDFYCSLVCEHLGLKPNCVKQRREHLQHASSQKKMVSYSCHGGLTHIFYPFMDFLKEKNMYGIVYISSLRTLTAPPATIKYLWDANTNAPDLLRKSFLHIPYFRDYDISNMVSLLANIRELFFAASPTYTESPKTITDIVEYMKHNYAAHITLSEAAAMINKSISRTSHLFLETFGKSFKEIQAEIIIEKAGRIIAANPAVPVKELASSLGFNDSFYFSKFYKKQTGSTVSESKRSLEKQS